MVGGGKSAAHAESDICDWNRVRMGSVFVLGRVLLIAPQKNTSFETVLHIKGISGLDSREGFEVN